MTFRVRDCPAWLWSLPFLVLFLSGPLKAAEACLDCHDVDPDRIADSVHGFLECLDCHPAASELPHPEEEIGTPACVNCHEGETRDYGNSIHGQLGAAGDPLVEGCHGCHGDSHAMLPSTDPQAPTHADRQPATCGHCHSSPEMAARHEIHLVQPLEAYTESVHARALAAGLDAPACSTCHGSHAVLRPSDPESRAHHLRISETCSRCHGEIYEDYQASVHGRAVATGVWEAPVCTDCHGEHRILEPQHEASPVYPTNIPKLTCGRCHDNIRLSEKYGIPADKVPAYEDSFHGLASRGGVLRVANCASCHGVHDILASTDPRSHTYVENLDETCGQCHPGAGQRFAIGPVHVLPEQPQHPVVYWVRQAYLWLIFLTIGGMVLHNLLDFVRKVMHPLPRPEPSEVPQRERMSRGFRIAHVMLLTSFIVLVYTGFALKFPESWWACPIPWIEGSCVWRGTIHRVAAVVILAAALFHLGHLVVDRSARRMILGMVPNRRDWIDFKGRVGYFLGRQSHPPKTAWLSYGEKMEYLAVVWGTAVMAVTGFMLWFENLALRWLPSWALDVATVIHWYEAILASLAIVVWHFYAVIFDPAVYPMDTAWISGRSAPAREIEREDPPTEAGHTPDMEIS